MMRENQRQRVWPLTWTWVIPSSSCMKLCAVPGTARASWFLSLSCSYRPGKTTQTTTTRLVSPSAFIRSSMTELCFHSAVFMLLNLFFFLILAKLFVVHNLKKSRKKTSFSYIGKYQLVLFLICSSMFSSMICFIFFFTCILSFLSYVGKCGIKHTHCTVQFSCALLPKCESP